MDEQSQGHSPICVEAAMKKSLLEGYHVGTDHGFEEAIAVVKGLPLTASAADALRELEEHREMWASVTGASVDLLAARGADEPVTFGQGRTPPGGSGTTPQAR